MSAASVILSGDPPRGRALTFLLLVILIALAFAPFLFPGTASLNVAAKICYFVVLAASYDLLLGYTGIVSFAHLYKIPLLMLISYRGSIGERDPWQTQGGNVTEPLLRALRIPYFFLDTIDTAKKRIRQAQTLAESSLQPVALLLTRDLMWEE